MKRKKTEKRGAKNQRYRGDSASKEKRTTTNKQQ
jgi:hypothetical protein